MSSPTVLRRRSLTPFLDGQPPQRQLRRMTAVTWTCSKWVDALVMHEECRHSNAYKETEVDSDGDSHRGSPGLDADIQDVIDSDGSDANDGDGNDDGSMPPPKKQKINSTGRGAPVSTPASRTAKSSHGQKKNKGNTLVNQIQDSLAEQAKLKKDMLATKEASRAAREKQRFEHEATLKRMEMEEAAKIRAEDRRHNLQLEQLRSDMFTQVLRAAAGGNIATPGQMSLPGASSGSIGSIPPTPMLIDDFSLGIDFTGPNMFGSPFTQGLAFDTSAPGPSGTSHSG